MEVYNQMGCQVCKKKTKEEVCEECKDVLEWLYPEQAIEEVLNNYEQLKQAHHFLKKYYSW